MIGSHDNNGTAKMWTISTETRTQANPEMLSSQHVSCRQLWTLHWTQVGLGLPKPSATAMHRKHSALRKRSRYRCLWPRRCSLANAQRQWNLKSKIGQQSNTVASVCTTSLPHSDNVICEIAWIACYEKQTIFTHLQMHKLSRPHKASPDWY